MFSFFDWAFLVLVVADRGLADAPAFAVSWVVFCNRGHAALAIALAVAVVSAVRLGHQTLLPSHVAVDLVQLQPISVSRIGAAAGLRRWIQLGGTLEGAGSFVRLLGATFLIGGTFGRTLVSPAPFCSHLFHLLSKPPLSSSSTATSATIVVVVIFSVTSAAVAAADATLPKGGVIYITNMGAGLPAIGFLNWRHATPLALVIVTHGATTEFPRVAVVALRRPSASFLECPIVNALGDFRVRTFQISILTSMSRTDVSDFAAHLAFLLPVNDGNRGTTSFALRTVAIVQAHLIAGLPECSRVHPLVVDMPTGAVPCQC